MFGKNKITKKSSSYDGTLNVTEVFKTIQGEGPFSGVPAVFVRLQGCNLRCKMCDTQFDEGKRYGIKSELMPLILENEPISCNGERPLVVITGGEPLLQFGVVVLVEFLVGAGFRVQLETSGTVWQNIFDSLLMIEGCGEHISFVCSPKTGEVVEGLRPWVTAYKYIVRDKEVSEEDGLPNVSVQTGKPLQIARPTSGVPVYVMPIDDYSSSRNTMNIQTAVNSAMKFGYKLCLQVHKLCSLP